MRVFDSAIITGHCFRTRAMPHDLTHMWHTGNIKPSTARAHHKSIITAPSQHCSTHEMYPQPSILPIDDAMRESGSTLCRGRLVASHGERGLGIGSGATLPQSAEQNASVYP